MTVRQMLDKIFRCYGSEIILERSWETRSFLGFFQPDQSRAKQNLHPEMTPTGLALPGQYLLLCPMEPELLVGDTVIVGGTAYQRRRREILTEKGTPLYQWALCTKKGGADNWADPS